MAEKTARQKDILGILDQVANEVSGELDLPKVLQNIARLIKQVVDYSAIVIALLDEGEYFTWVLQQGYDPEALRALDATTEEGIIGEAVRRKEVIAVNDVSGDPRYLVVPMASGAIPSSELAVPLINKDRAIGVMAIESTEPNAFGEDHILMMRSIATHLAAAVANARLYEETVEQLRTMTVIERIGQELVSVLDLEALLRDIARLTRQVIDYQAFGIFLVDRDKGVFVNRYAQGYDRAALRERPVKLDEGLRGRALREGRPIIVADATKDPNHVRLKLEIDDDIRSQMVVPLMTKKGILGLLVLGHVRKGYYTDRHLRIAGGMANQIAIALRNARVFEKAAIREEGLRHELDVARKVQLSMLPEEIPQVSGFDIDAVSIPAERVGGDFYDYIRLPGGKLGLIVGDVSGFGLPAALVLNSAREAIRIYAEFDPDPATVMNRADRRLHRDLGSHMMVALLYGVLDPSSSVFTFCNAGLPEPALVRDYRGHFIPALGGRLPLGKMPRGDYKARKVKLRPGDFLVLLTDGAVEAWNDKEQQFGFRRLLRTLKNAAMLRDSAPSKRRELISMVLGEIQKFVGHPNLQDDVTIVAITAESSCALERAES